MRILSKYITCLIVLMVVLTGIATQAEEAADALAAEIHAQALQNEKEVTLLLQSMESESMYLTGLEHCLKSPESIARKLLLNAHDMEISPEEAVETIHDALRYTFIIADEAYTSGADAVLKALTQQGYSVERVSNTWKNDGYKGINTNLTTPDGYWFEIQFHTQDSFETKEFKTHYLYEIVRSEDSTEAEKLEADAKMREIFATVPVPDDAADYVWNITVQPSASQ